MNNFFSRLSDTKLRILFYSSLTILNLVQAWGTELFDDEAYYWVYSRFLDWGYFDHPPIIALLIRMGNFLFHGELGVRFFIVIIAIITIYLIEYFTKPKDLKLFYAIVLNIAILQIGGVIAVPDIPLLFFTALFFIIYKQYENQSGYRQAFLLSLIVALLLYSKYHGILIILATLFSNIGLLRRPITWLVITTSFLLYLPHVLWQANNGFPSIVYQLYGWPPSEYRISYTTDYLLGQLLIAGPLLGWLIIWSALRVRPSNKVEKAMIWSIFLVYGIFFLSSFRGSTEVNWTILLLVPLIYLAYQHLSTDKRKAKWVYNVLPYSLVLIFIVRIYMFFDFQVYQFAPKDEFHGNKKWVANIKSNADGRPVLFTNSFQRASKYWFYSGDTSFSLNTYAYRQNHFNLWPLEVRLQGKEILIAGDMDKALVRDSVHLPKSKLAIAIIDTFDSHSQIMIKQENDLVITHDRKINASLSFSSISVEELNRAVAKEPELYMIIYWNRKQKIVVRTGKKLDQDAVKGILVDVSLPNLDKKQYRVRWGLSNSVKLPTINSSFYDLNNLQ